MIPVPERTALLTDWLQQLQPNRAFDLTPASSDASFRRYFRVTDAHGSQIAMDAPPEKEELGNHGDLAAMGIGIGTRQWISAPSR